MARWRRQRCLGGCCLQTTNIGRSQRLAWHIVFPFRAEHLSAEPKDGTDQEDRLHVKVVARLLAPWPRGTNHDLAPILHVRPRDELFEHGGHSTVHLIHFRPTGACLLSHIVGS